MADLCKEKYKNQVLTFKERVTSFNEVSLTYNEETARKEAKRCLNCKHFPCMEGCTLHNHIPMFISLIAEGKFIEAYEELNKTTSLPSICGRICPKEKQCEGSCIRGKNGESVSIGNLERFVAEYYYSIKKDNKIDFTSNEKIAIVGGGPSGLVCASELAKLGYKVTIYEKEAKLGGALTYLIPSFRLPYHAVANEIKKVYELGVEVRLNTEINILDLLLKEGYSAMFIALGASKSKPLGIKGEHLKGIYSANDFLYAIRKIQLGEINESYPLEGAKKILVIGGGNVALDAARSAKRLGAEVIVIYRRTEKEMPAFEEEIKHALEENIKFMYLVNPKEFIGVDCVNKVVLTRNELGTPDQSGRCRPVEIKGSEFIIDNVDGVITAISSYPNSELLKEQIELNSWDGIIIDENGRTSIENVYAGGDVVTGPLTLTNAMIQGKKAARAIHEMIMKKRK